jgi:hypothetical protein
VCDAIGALRRYSLVTPAADGSVSVSVHRLIQAVTADQMPAELAREWQQATAAVIEDAIPGDTEPPETWPIFAALLPHAQAALANGSAGIARIADYLGWSGSYAAARDLQQRIVDARERLHGPEHPDILAARAYLATLTGRAGHPAAARDQYAALLQVRERSFGLEHPDTLAAQYHLARWTGEAGEVAAARDLFAALLPVRERVLGPEHPDTLWTRAHLARWTGEARDPAGARDQFAALLPMRERSPAPSTRTPLPSATTSPTGLGAAAASAERAAAQNLLVMTAARARAG